MKTIGANIVLEGEQQYREALKTISVQQKALSSEMALTSAQFKGQQNSLEALEKQYEVLGKQIAKQRERIDVYNDALESAKKRQNSAAETVDKYEKELEEARTKLDAMKNSSETTEDALADQEKEVERLENAYKAAGEELQQSEKDVASWQNSLNKAQTDLVGMENTLEKTGKYIDEAKESVDKNAKSIDEYGNEVEAADKKTSIFGETLKSSLASEAIIAAVGKLAGAIKDAAMASLEVGSEFEASMSQVAATMGMTAEEINNGSESYQMLADAAKHCGETTKYSASEAADALNYLALAGYSAEKSVEVLPRVLDLAAAGGLDLATASDMVTDAMAALGMESRDLDKYIDEMTKTAQKSNTSVAQLGEATLVAAGAVSTAGVDLETMNAELGVLANNGIKGAEGGTHLRNVILSLAAPTETAAEALEALGVEIKDNTTGNMRDLNAIIYDLNASLDTMGSVEKTQYIKQIFNKTDIAAVNALLKGTNGEFDLLKHELELSAGAARDMADTMNNNLKGKVTILQSALEGLGISVYEVFDDDVKRGVDSATEAVTKLNESVKDGEMGASLNKLSEQIGDLMEDATDAAMDTLPKVINGLSEIIDHLDIIIPVAEGVVTGFVAFKVATEATAALNAVLALLPPILEATTIEQAALNAVQAISPMGALAAAAGLLVTSLSLLVSTQEVYTPAVAKMTEEQKKFVDAANATTKAADDNRTSFENNTATMAANETQSQRLIARLKELEPVAKSDSEKMDEMQTVVDQLNTLMPELGLSINSVTGELNMSTEAVERYSEAFWEKLQFEANQERIVELYKQQTEIESELIKGEDAYNEALAKREEALEAYRQANDEYNEALEAGDDATWLRWAREEALETSQVVIEETSEITRAHADLQNSYESTTEELERLKGVVSDTSAEETATAALEEMSQKEVEWRGYAIQATGDVDAKLEELSEAYLQAKQAAADSLQSQMGLFQEFTVESHSLDEMTKNTQAQADTLTNYGDNLQKALDLEIDPQIIADIEEMGLSGAGYLDELVRAAEAAKEGLPGAAEEYQNFIDAWNDYQQALDKTSSKMGEFETIMAETGGQIVLDLEDNQAAMLEDQGTFSETYVQSWTDMGNDAAQAIADAEPLIMENTAMIADTAINTLNTELGITGNRSSKGYDAGNTFMKSVGQAILDMEDELVDDVASVGRKMVEEAKEWSRKVNEALGEDL